MRLYCIIPNYVFFEKIIRNPNKIGHINCDDLEGTQLINFTYDTQMPDLLQYLGKKDWVADSICAFTTPAECRTYLDPNSVMFSFEIAKEDCVAVNADVLYKSLEMQILHDKKISNINIIKKSYGEEYIDIEEKFAKFKEKQLCALCQTASYYDTLMIVKEIDISSIKTFFIKTSNNQFNEIKKAMRSTIIEKNTEMGD